MTRDQRAEGDIITGKRKIPKWQRKKMNRRN